MYAYVHDWDPVIFDIWRGLKLRWYGFSYLMAFVAAYYLLTYLSRKNLWVVAEKQIGDFIALLAMLGVFVGGRLGYVLFYMLPTDGMALLREDPLAVIRVWDGGMASHGGFLGVAIFTYFYARKHQISWTGIGDGICIVAPLGLCFGRMANFINGELYGRVAPNLPWGVKFPQALATESYTVQESIVSACADRAPEFSDMVMTPHGLSEAVRQSAEVRAIAEQYLTARHPSQLYEGLLEGLLIFSVMWFLRFRFPRAQHGMLCGIFFILYGMLRILAEQFREPDSAMIGIFTKGQFYSLFMVLAGVAFLATMPREKNQH
jgi:phosphatidylglycerol:prolipoprotein diacylglycerol transferase